jgi:diguanylate cyclase
LIAKRLKALADDVSTSVGEHRTQLDQASRILTSDERRTDEALAELVVDVIDDMVRANHNLQTKLESAEGRLQAQAAEIEAHISRSLTDPVTGMPNRREFNARLEERMSAWSRRREVFTLLLLDVDHFKRLNDQYGHLVGDRVLAAIGPALRAAVRREDSVARYGGEEFAVLLPGTTLEQAAGAAQHVREALGRVSVEHNGNRISVTVSGGLAMIRGNESSESLIQRADSALYAAKAGGRDCNYIHDGALCRPANPRRDQFPEPPQATSKSSASTNKRAAVEPSADVARNDSGTVASSFLSSEEISPELAETCEELRRFVEERDRQHREVTPVSQA